MDIKCLLRMRDHATPTHTRTHTTNVVYLQYNLLNSSRAVSTLMGEYRAVLVFSCIVLFLTPLYFYKFMQPSGGLEYRLKQAGRTLTSDFDVDVVNVKSSFPEKVLKHLDLGSRSWQGYYHTKCCSDIYINVRTSRHTQESRLPLIITTWMQTLPPNQVN